MSEWSADDEEVRKLVGVLIRTLIYVVKWLAKRYNLNDLVHMNKRPR